jgi:hypothetical protein
MGGGRCRFMRPHRLRPAFACSASSVTTLPGGRLVEVLGLVPRPVWMKVVPDTIASEAELRTCDVTGAVQCRASNAGGRLFHGAAAISLFSS